MASLMENGLLTSYGAIPEVADEAAPRRGFQRVQLKTALMVAVLVAAAVAVAVTTSAPASPVKAVNEAGSYHPPAHKRRMSEWEMAAQYDTAPAGQPPARRASEAADGKMAIAERTGNSQLFAKGALDRGMTSAPQVPGGGAPAEDKEAARMKEAGALLDELLDVEPEEEEAAPTTETVAVPNVTQDPAMLAEYEAAQASLRNDAGRLEAVERAFDAAKLHGDGEQKALGAARDESDKLDVAAAKAVAPIVSSH